MLHYLERLRRLVDGLIETRPRRVLADALQVVRFLNLVFIEFYHDRCFTLASNLAFSSAFALVPVSTFYFSIFAAFPNFRDLILRARSFILEQLVPQSNMKDEVIRYFNELTANVYGLTSLSVLFLVATSALLFITLEDSLNRVFAVQQFPPLKRSLVTFTILLFWGPILMGFSAYLWLEGLRFQAVSSVAISTWGSFCLTFLVSWVMFFGTYWLLPYGQSSVIPSLLGGFVGALLWELAKEGFGLYLRHAFVYSIVYGSVGFIPVSLLWIYTSSLIFLFGAKVSFCYQFKDMLDLLGGEARRDPILLAYAAMASFIIIGRRFRKGDSPATIELLSRQVRAPGYMIQTGLVALEEKRFLYALNRRKDTFLPARSLESIRMSDVFWTAFPETPVPDSDHPGVRYVRNVVAQSREAISHVLGCATLAEVVDDEKLWRS